MESVISIGVQIEKDPTTLPPRVEVCVSKTTSFWYVGFKKNWAAIFIAAQVYSGSGKIRESKNSLFRHYCPCNAEYNLQ